MAIPKAALDLVKRPVIAYAGSRDTARVPGAHFTWGIRAVDDEHIEALVPEPFLGSLRANLADNGQFAVTFTEAETHVSYQVKGKTTEVRDATDADRAFQREWSKKVVEVLGSLGFPPHWMAAFERFPMLPATLVRFRVENVFEQTPGPSAGRALNPDNDR
jgi:hypothetical protein